MRVRKSCSAAAVLLLAFSVVGLLEVGAAFAAAPGPYISSAAPGDGSQYSIETTKVGVNSNSRDVQFTLAADDPDGIMSPSVGQSTLVLSSSGVPTVTLYPTLSYVAGSAETKATFYTALKTSATLLPEGYWNATFTVRDKTGAASVYSWRFFAAYTMPAVDFHVPARDSIAALLTSKISANVSGPRNSISTATMRLDGQVVPATLTKVSNTVNTLEYTPSSPLAEGLHRVDISATNSGGYANTYSWSFTASALQPAFTSLIPTDGAQIVADGSGEFGFSALCQDLDGIDASSVSISVRPPDAATFTVTPIAVARTASSRRNVDVSARIPVTAATGDVVITAGARDLLGNSRQKTITYHLPPCPPIIDATTPAAPPSTKSFSVGARMRDTGSGVATPTIRLRVDGALLTPSLAATTGGYVVSAPVTYPDNSSHVASITLSNIAGLSTSATWTFTVRASPVITVVSPSVGTTWTLEDVPIAIHAVETDDGVDLASARVFFDGAPISDASVKRAGAPGNFSADVSATVLSVGGFGSTAHSATVVIADTRGYTTTTTWNFTVYPQSGRADMAIDTNEPCLSSKCHDMSVDDYTKWNQLHWVVGDAHGWGVPSTNTPHKYNCNICHYGVWDASANRYTAQPVYAQGLTPCQLCHLVLGESTTPVGTHGGGGNPYLYRFKDHDDSSTYAINTPSYGRDCLYCHQGKKGTEEVDGFANNTTTKAHDIVADHRVNLPSGCEDCHSAVLTREHAVDRDGDGTTIHCDGCHGSSDPDVLAAIKSYPALRYRFWGTNTATYNTWPVPTATPAYSMETTAYYEIPGKRITGARVRLVTSTLGVFTVEGQSGTDAWTTLYTKSIGGTGDGSPGGNNVEKPFPTYPSAIGTFTCAPVDRVRIRYAPTAVGWHYVSANVDSWVVQGAQPTTCDSCHKDAGHPHPALVLSPACASCHKADIVAEHVGRTADDGTTLGCATCHSSTDPNVIQTIAGGATSCYTCHLGTDAALHAAIDHNADVTATLDPSGFACADCHLMNVVNEHSRSSSSSAASGCATCHPTPYDTFTTWGGTCEQGGCHATGSATERHSAESSAHAPSAQSSACTASGCHDAGNLTAIHASAEDTATETTSCLVCHSDTSVPPTNVCQACHTDKIDSDGNVVAHGYDPTKHASIAGTQTLSGSYPAPGDSPTYNPPYAYSQSCGDCHTDVVLGSLHASATATPLNQVCTLCHPSPRDTVSPWDKTCTQGGCHPAGTEEAQHANILTAHSTSTTSTEYSNGGCSVKYRNAYPCHYQDLVQEHNRTITGGEAIPWDVISVSCATCHNSPAFKALNGTWDGTCGACHRTSSPDANTRKNHAEAGSARALDWYSRHNNMLNGQIQPYQDVTGTHVGTNTIDVHGSKPLPPTAGKSGCDTIHCHTSGYLAPGYVPSAGTVTGMCPDCHGKNVLVEPPPVPGYGAYAWFATGSVIDSPPATWGETFMYRSMGALPAGSHLRFVTRFSMNSNLDYWAPWVSTNGTTWTQLTDAQETSGNLAPYRSGYGDWSGDTNGAWLQTDWNLSAVANGRNQVYIKFSFTNYGDFGGGIYVDNITAGLPNATPVFSDDAETDTTSLWTRYGSWRRKAN